MALVNCPECGREISDTCEKCIHCGFEFKKTDNGKKRKIVFAAICTVVAILAIVLFVFQGKSKVPDGYTEEVWRSAETYIESIDEFIASGEYDCPDEVTDFLSEVAMDTFSSNGSYLTNDYVLAEYFMTVDLHRLTYMAKTGSLEELDTAVNEMKDYMDYAKLK